MSRLRDVRFAAILLWAVAGAFAFAAFVKAPGRVETLCGIAGIALVIGITPFALPPWRGSPEGKRIVIVAAALQSGVVIAAALVFGR